MLFGILDKIAESSGEIILVTLITNLGQLGFHVWRARRKDTRNESDELYKRAVDFMNRQEVENAKLRAGWAACEKAHERTRKIYIRERQLLQDQITEMTDFIGKRYGHTFQAQPLPEESDEPSPSPLGKRRKKKSDKDTDDALDALPREGNDDE